MRLEEVNLTLGGDLVHEGMAISTFPQDSLDLVVGLAIHGRQLLECLHLGTIIRQLDELAVVVALHLIRDGTAIDLLQSLYHLRLA